MEITKGNLVRTQGASIRGLFLIKNFLKIRIVLRLNPNVSSKDRVSHKKRSQLKLKLQNILKLKNFLIKDSCWPESFRKVTVWPSKSIRKPQNNGDTFVSLLEDLLLLESSMLESSMNAGVWFKHQFAFVRVANLFGSINPGCLNNFNKLNSRSSPVPGLQCGAKSLSIWIQRVGILIGDYKSSCKWKRVLLASCLSVGPIKCFLNSKIQTFVLT